MVHTSKAAKGLIALLSCETLLGCATVKGSGASKQSTLIARGAALDAHTHLISQPLLDGLTGGGVPTAGAEDLIAQLGAELNATRVQFASLVLSIAAGSDRWYPLRLHASAERAVGASAAFL